jgi:hypothetical protein
MSVANIFHEKGFYKVVSFVLAFGLVSVLVLTCSEVFYYSASGLVMIESDVSCTVDDSLGRIDGRTQYFYLPKGVYQLKTSNGAEVGYIITTGRSFSVEMPDGKCATAIDPRLAPQLDCQGCAQTGIFTDSPD